jgi:hypothetical protein
VSVRTMRADPGKSIPAEPFHTTPDGRKSYPPPVRRPEVLGGLAAIAREPPGNASALSRSFSPVLI